jgi:hypothetical protein
MAICRQLSGGWNAATEFSTNPTPPKEVYGKARIFGTDDEEKQLEFLNRSLAALADRH